MSSVKNVAICSVILGCLIKQPWPVSLLKGRSITLAKIGVTACLGYSIFRYSSPPDNPSPKIDRTDRGRDSSQPLPVSRGPDRVEINAVSVQAEDSRQRAEDSRQRAEDSRQRAEDSRQRYVEVTLIPPDSGLSDVATRIWILADVSGSMDFGSRLRTSQGGSITRIEAVQQGVWKLVKSANERREDPKNIDFRFFKFDHKFQEGLSGRDKGSITEGDIQRFYAKGGRTIIYPALNHVCQQIDRCQDNRRNVFLFLTDGHDSGFLRQNLTSCHSILEQHHVSVVSVGISQDHNTAVLSKVLLKPDGTHLADSKYCYVDGEDIQEGSREYAEGKRTFDQIVKEVWERSTSQIALQRVSISLIGMTRQPVPIVPVGQVEKKNVHMLGLLQDEARSVVLKVDGEVARCIVRAKDGANRNFVEEVDVGIEVSKRPEILWKALDADAKAVMQRVVETYVTGGANVKIGCIKEIDNMLERINKSTNLLTDFSQAVQSLCNKLRDIKGKIEANEKIDTDQRARLLAEVTHGVSGIGGGRVTHSSTNLATAQAMEIADTGGVAVSGIGGSSFSPGRVTIIQRALGEVLKGTQRQVDGVESGVLSMDVRNVVLGSGEYAIQMPMGYNRLNLGKGLVMNIMPHEAYEDGSMTGSFEGRSRIATFGRKHKLEFRLHIAPEAKINLEKKTREAAGLPSDGTHFQWIAPAAGDPDFRKGCLFDWTEPGLGAEDKKRRTAQFHQTMKKELSLAEYNLLTIGGFVYHAGLYYLPKDPENKTIYFDREAGSWMNGDGEVIPDNEASALLRDTAELRVLNPNQVLGKQVFPLGKMEETLPTAVHEKLQEWNLDEDTPYFDKITFGFLLEMGFTDFKWLNYGDPLIEQTRNQLVAKARTDGKPQPEIEKLKGWGHMGFMSTMGRPQTRAR